jgi:hypothetical protein
VIELGGRYLRTGLRESNDALADPSELAKRLRDDGFVLLRGLLDRDAVLDTRQSILRPLQDSGVLAPGVSLRGDVVTRQTSPHIHAVDWKNAELRELTHSAPLVDLFAGVLGGPVVTYDFKWLRGVGGGYYTRMHWDSIFWEQGDVFSAWIPLGDIPVELGPLAMLCGAPQFVDEARQAPRVLRESFTFMSNIDAFDIMDRTGGWLETTDFRAGDVIVFTMYTAHTSLRNETNRLRLSVDVRYQLQSEPIDPQYMGDEPSHRDVIKEIRYQLVNPL